MHILAWLTTIHCPMYWANPNQIVLNYSHQSLFQLTQSVTAETPYPCQMRHLKHLQHIYLANKTNVKFLLVLH